MTAKEIDLVTLKECSNVILSQSLLNNDWLIVLQPIPRPMGSFESFSKNIPWKQIWMKMDDEAETCFEATNWIG